MATKTLYEEILREHYRNPRHRGILDRFDYQSGMVNPSCGDEISVQCCLHNGTITEIAHTGAGCMISQATASLWAEYLMGKTKEQILALSVADIQKILNLEFGPYRARCAFLFIEALQKALYSNS
jgi:nitrogen fixation protein NifU and related proteins